MWCSPSVTTCCSSPPSATALDIQTRMEKYLLADSGGVGGSGGGSRHDFEGGTGGGTNDNPRGSDPGSGAGSADDGQPQQRCCHDDRSSSTSRMMTMMREFSAPSAMDVKPTNRFLHSDVLDLHKDGGGSNGGRSGGHGSGAGAPAVDSMDRDSKGAIGRWQPLDQSPPRAHNHATGGLLSPPPSAGIGSSSHGGLLSRSSVGSVPSRHHHHQHSSSGPAGTGPSSSALLDRFMPVAAGMRDRFDLAGTGGNGGGAGGGMQDVLSMEPTSSTMPTGGGGVSTTSPITSAAHGPSSSTGKPVKTVKSYHCRMCEQEFANKSDMQRHAKEAHRMEDKGHKCAQCLKSFPSSQQLAQHSLVHSNVRKYACSYCDKAFKQLSHVQQHQRIHTGERPYRCPVDGCLKAFRQLSSLQQHLKGHNVPMPKSYAVCRALPPLPQASIGGSNSPQSSGSPSSSHETSSGNKLNSSLARPHDLTCQVCEKHCADEVRFFCHIHKYHPDYWRVFSGGRPLSDFIETPTSKPLPSPSTLNPDTSGAIVMSAPPHHREKRYACTVCHKRYSHETGYVKHMAGHPGFSSTMAGSDGVGGAATSGVGFNRVSLYNCTVCAKLFTKEAYLLRHMEMKLDPAHTAGLEELKKSSGMFRSSSTAAAAAAAAVLAASHRPVSYSGDGRLRSSNLEGNVSKMLLSRPASVDPPDDQLMSSPPSSGRYMDDIPSRRSSSDVAVVMRQMSRSASCISPMSSASSASPSSPPPQSFMPYPAVTRDDPRRTPFMPADVVHHPQPLPASDYLRRSMDVYRSPPYVPLSTVTSHSSPPQHADDDMQDESSPEIDDGRDMRNHHHGGSAPRYSSSTMSSGLSIATGQQRHHTDYYSPSSPYSNRFQPFPSPVGTLSRSGMVSPGIAASSPFTYPQYPPYGSGPSHLQDTYLRRSIDFSDRETINNFR